MTPRYARSAIGKRAVGTAPANHGKNISVLGAINCEGVVAAMTVEGATDSDVFLVFLKDVLIPALKPGDIVVMDNLSVHKVSGVRELIESADAQLLYLRPYSPDLSPIEPCWSKVKTLLRKTAARSKDRLFQAIAEALAAVTPQDAAGWFSHCGYRL